jgi:hypothetical protein
MNRVRVRWVAVVLAAAGGVIACESKGLPSPQPDPQPGPPGPQATTIPAPTPPTAPPSPPPTAPQAAVPSATSVPKVAPTTEKAAATDKKQDGATPPIVAAATPDAAAAPPSAPATTPAAPVSARSTGEHYVLVVTAPGDCTVGAECRAILRLTATNGFHINKEYPYSFKAEASTRLEYMGKDARGAAYFSKAAGDFQIQGETNADLTVRFRPKEAGLLTFEGAYSMSVCSESNCDVQKPKVTLAVPVR